MTTTPEDTEHPLIAPFAGVDIYVFDQLLKGRIAAGMRVLDAGCGSGRNAACLARVGCEVYGVDESDDALAGALERVRAHDAAFDARRFSRQSIDALSFDDGAFDAVVCVAVLHFARDEAQFDAMLDELWRVLRPGGVLLARLATSIGIEDRVEALGGNRYHLPDGTDRYLMDEAALLGAAARIGGELLDPIKTTNVQNTRAMTTWCLRK